MSGRIRRAARLTLILLALAVTSGCGKILPPGREINDFQLITVAGMDRQEQAGGVTLTLSAKKTGDKKDGGEEGSGGDKPFLISRGAATAARAFEEMSTATDKHIFLGHARAVLIGERLADDGLKPCFDYLLRDHALRPDVRLYIVKGTDARELLENASDNDSFAADRLRSLELDLRRTSDSGVTSLLDAAAAMASGGAALLPVLTVGDASFEPDGFAVIRDYKPAGYIGAEDAPYVNLLRGKFYEAVMESSESALHISRVTRRYGLVWENGAPARLTVDVSFHADAGESRSEPGISQKVNRRDETEIAQKLRDGAARALDAARQSGADYLGIAAALDMRHPFRFAPYREKWDEIFSDLEAEVRVHAKK